MWGFSNVLVSKTGNRIRKHFEIEGFVIVGFVFDYFIVTIHTLFQVVSINEGTEYVEYFFIFESIP